MSDTTLGDTSLGVRGAYSSKKSGNCQDPVFFGARSFVST